MGCVAVKLIQCNILRAQNIYQWSSDISLLHRLIINKYEVSRQVNQLINYPTMFKQDGFKFSDQKLTSEQDLMTTEKVAVIKCSIEDD